MEIKKTLIGLSKEELVTTLNISQEEKFRVNQLWNWLYVKGATSFDQMTNLSKHFKQELDNLYTLMRPTIATNQLSKDGTQKWLIRLHDGNEIETVYIPTTRRNTLCVSSQVGCNMACKFCKTGTQRMVRNLTAAEIVFQVLIAKDQRNDWDPQDKDISNIVFMGMGEPLQNYNEVKKAILILTASDGLNFSNRKVTLSTSGIIPNMVKMDQDLNVNLALSLHAATDALRTEIMPINAKYPLKELIESLKNYQSASNVRRITIEYVMLRDINDSLEDAKELVALLKGIPVKINLIPFNPWPGSIYECSHPEVIKAFADYLNNNGLSAPVRESRGQDISAACGQLRSSSERIKPIITAATEN
ncbi:23S rRNA (adenine(2503)-C(2))-methyltransferase RlmN [Rickettsiales bacterium LUAb2]